MEQRKLSPLIIIILIAIALIVIGLIIWAIVRSTNQNRKYDGKVVELTSTDGRLIGKIALNTNGKYLKAYYHLLANDTYLMNNNCSNQIESCQPNTSYDYAVDLSVASSTGGEGSFLPVYCNKDKFPDNLFALNSALYTECATNGGATTTFEATFSKDFQNFDELKSSNQITIYDAANFWEASKSDQKDGGEDFSRTLNADRAVQEGIKVRTYQLTFKQPS